MESKDLVDKWLSAIEDRYWTNEEYKKCEYIERFKESKW